MDQKRELWLLAMSNVAAAHHQLIVNEYNQLLMANGVTIDIDMMSAAAREMILNSLPSSSSIAGSVPKKIECIRDLKHMFHLGLKEAKEIVEEQIEILRTEGKI